MNGLKLNADDIVNFLKTERFNNNFTLGVSEFCPYHEGRRLDMFYFNRWNRETRGYEIKVSREDFLQDKKWESYLKFCTWFYFVAPVGIIKPEELPDGIGLIEIEVNEREPYHFSDKEFAGEAQKEVYLSKKFTKKAKRLHDVQEQDYTKLLEGLLIKVIYNKNIL